VPRPETTSVLPSLTRRAKRSASWAFSGALHGLVLFLAYLLLPAFTPASPVDPVLISAAINPARPRISDENKKRSVLERSRSLRFTTLPAFSRPLQEPHDIPHSSITLPDLEVPLGLPDSAMTLTNPGRGTRGISGTGTRAKTTRVGDGSGNKTENAIEAALKWLAGQQKPDGSWSLSPGWKNHVRCWSPTSKHRATGDPYGTSMALLAFSGAGYSRDSGRYKTTVKRGINWLLKPRNDKVAVGGRRIRRLSSDPHELGLVALALSEATCLSPEKRVRNGAQLAIDAISEHYTGKWRSCHLTAAVWNALAFKAAQNAGLRCKAEPQITLRSIVEVSRLGNTEFGYGAMRRGHGIINWNNRKGLAYANPGGAVATLCLYDSRKKKDLKHVFAAITSRPKIQIEFSGHPLLYMHHAAVAMRMKGGPAWKQYRTRVFPIVLKKQIRKGKDCGAWKTYLTGYRWPGDDLYRANVFATALAVMTLESALKHSPLYR
jgi:hypothetical protein